MAFLFQCLHQLGLSHVLKLYLCGVRSIEGEWREGGEELEKHLYESAWRLTQWEDSSGGIGALGAAAPGSGGGGGVKGYHHSLYNCITAIRDGEAKPLLSSLAEAR